MRITRLKAAEIGQDLPLLETSEVFSDKLLDCTFDIIDEVKADG